VTFTLPILHGLALLGEGAQPLAEPGGAMEQSSANRCDPRPPRRPIPIPDQGFGSNQVR
jgi:hypothetical protein